MLADQKNKIFWNREVLALQQEMTGWLPQSYQLCFLAEVCEIQAKTSTILQLQAEIEHVIGHRGLHLGNLSVILSTIAHKCMPTQCILQV